MSPFPYSIDLITSEKSMRLFQASQIAYMIASQLWQARFES